MLKAQVKFEIHDQQGFPFEDAVHDQSPGPIILQALAYLIISIDPS
jgi:hypothetical protein